MIPKHVAIIMDGNGRWAKDKGLPREFGHQNGFGHQKSGLVTKNQGLVTKLVNKT